jgi:hypothetical protein
MIALQQCLFDYGGCLIMEYVLRLVAIVMT